MKKQILILLTVCLLAVLVFSVSATDTGMQIQDDAGLLTDKQSQKLNDEVIRISQEYDCGIYVMTVDRWQDYGGSDVLDCAEEVYESYHLGYGQDADGLLLLLSMEERDYALYYNGYYAGSIFNDYALKQLEAEFLDDLANDDWAGGIRDYIDTCEAILLGDFAINEYPDDAYIYTDGAIWETEESFSLETLAVVFILPCVIALIVCLILKSQMKSVRKQSADAYISPGGLNLRIREDRFLYDTVTRRRIDTSSSSGRSGGGGFRSSGGRSGKF